MNPDAREPSTADLIFEGGGVKGIGLGGAFAALEKHGFAPHCVAGTSAGAIAAALVATGYTAEELDRVLRGIPYSDLEDEGFPAKLPIVGHALNVLVEKGIYEGKVFERWIKKLLEPKMITKFGQLKDPEAKNPKHRYRLQMIASDITHRRMLVLPQDADHLGVDPDELEIAYALRMSMSLPIVFEPVVHRNPRTGEDHLIIDGGVLSNFPVWLFDRDEGDPRWPTFGLLLVEPDPKVPIGHRLSADEHTTHPGSLLDYVKSLALTMMEAHDRQYLENATFARTIPIPTLGAGTTEFDISEEKAEALYDSGYEAASNFLKSWSFARYIEEFRRGVEHPRRSLASRDT
jgi:NTE family protein